MYAFVEIVKALPFIIICVLSAISFGMIWQVTRVFIVGWGVTLIVSQHVCWWMISELKLPFTVSYPFCVVVGILVSTLSEICIYRPLHIRKTPAGAIVVASLGLLIVFQAFIAIFFGVETKVLSTKHFWGSNVNVVLYAATIIALTLLSFLSKRIKILRLQQAVGDDSVLASGLGIKIFRVRLNAFIISGALASINSIFIAETIGVDISYGWKYLLISSVAILIGGSTNFTGWVVGGLLVGSVQIYAVWFGNSQYSDTYLFLTILLFILLKKNGLASSFVRVR